MSVDVRTRDDGPSPALDAERFFRETLPGALDANRAGIAPGAARLRLRPLAIETPDARATLFWRDDRAEVVPGADRDESVVWRLTAEAFADLVADQSTPMAMFSSGKLAVSGAGLTELLDWWLVLRAALDGRAIHTPGSVSFRARDGSPLDLDRAFASDDDPEEMSHFLHEAGFLHLRSWLACDRMDQISADMDAAVGDYRDGDGNSWWVTTRDGARRCVRMQCFDAKSPATSELLEDPAFVRIGELTGDGHRGQQGLVGNRVEALFKPIGVTQGISDVPWHKDCSLGRHSYDCSNLTTGISVTGATEDSGQLRVRPGSHRALCWPAFAQPGLDLPDRPLPTEKGDITVHLSCTLHMAQPPIARERRVLYTGFRLPDRSADAARARQKLRAVREAAPVTVSQEPSSARR
jgi:Phytanoyl-CoA dioxygenase (PhyH)